MRAGGYLSDQRHESWLVAGVCLALAAWVTACDVGELGALGRARFDTWSPCYSCPNARLVLPGARATIQVSTMTSWDAPCTNPGGRKTVGDPHVLALVGDPEYPPSSSCASIFIDVDGVAPGWTTVGITAPEDYYAFGTATGLAHLTVARVGGAWLDSAFADVDVRRLVVPAGTSEYLEAMLRDPDLVFIVPESVPEKRPPMSMQPAQEPGMARSLPKHDRPMAIMDKTGFSSRIEIRSMGQATA